jgi:hypothetical protein
VKEDLDPIKAFKNLYLPNQIVSEDISFYTEYKEKETDPFQRIINLKKELIETKLKIDEYAERFNDNSFIKQTDNLNTVVEELDMYKSKIDAFINYDIFNHLYDDEEKSFDSNDNNSKNNTETRTQFYSLFDKYNRLTENLLSQIKGSENDVINNNYGDMNIKYEIIANPEMQIDTLINRLNELEDLINNLERAIGSWHIVIILFYFLV